MSDTKFGTGLISAGVGDYLSSSAKIADAQIGLARTQEANDAIAAARNSITQIQTIVEYATPWVQLAETYIRNDGKLSPMDWAGAVASTLSTAVTDNALDANEYQNAINRMGVNLLVAGVVGSRSDVSREQAQSFFYNSVGNEIGQLLGGEILSALQGRPSAEDMAKPVFDPKTGKYMVRDAQGEFVPFSSTLPSGAGGATMTEQLDAQALSTEAPVPIAETGVTTSSGDDNVRHLQERYAALGLYDGPIDGIWGPKTQAAYDNISLMQSKLQEAGYDVGGVDGIFGPRTAEALNLATNDYQRRAEEYMAQQARPSAVAAQEIVPEEPGLFDRFVGAVDSGLKSIIDMGGQNKKDYESSIETAVANEDHVFGFLATMLKPIADGSTNILTGTASLLRLGTSSEARQDVANAAQFVWNNPGQTWDMAVEGIDRWTDKPLYAMAQDGITFTQEALTGGSIIKLPGILRKADDIVPDSIPAGNFSRSVAANARFLKESGITDPALRRQIIESGFRNDLLGPDTPITNARFNKLFVQTVEQGKAFSGRLGNIDTRVATINKAAEFERSGLIPRFEYPVNVDGGKRFVDLVGLDSRTRQPTNFVQFVKENNSGIIIRSDEIIAAQQIERSLNLSPGTVQLINTRR